MQRSPGQNPVKCWIWFAYNVDLRSVVFWWNLLDLAVVRVWYGLSELFGVDLPACLFGGEGKIEVNFGSGLRPFIALVVMATA